MNKNLKNIISPGLQFLHKSYFSIPRNFKYERLKFKVTPDVFPPNFLFSTKLMMGFMEELDLQDQRILDLGCGCGALGLHASFKGARATCVDINHEAVRTTRHNAKVNDLEVEVLDSDMLLAIKGRCFDIILINPPFYPRNAGSDLDLAWYCGEDHDYFKKLFYQLNKRFVTFDKLFMILSEDCDLEAIKRLAFEYDLSFEVQKKHANFWEKNTIFKLKYV